MNNIVNAYAPGLGIADTINLHGRPTLAAGKKDRLQAQLRALQADYAARFPALLEQIESCWQRLIEQGWRLQEVLELRQHMHKLAGSAASFGFVRIGQLASQIEDYLLNWESLLRPPAAYEQGAVAQLLQALRKEVDENISAADQAPLLCA